MLDRAGPDDAPTLLRLREQAARWLTGLGIAQWVPGEVSAAEVAGQVEAGARSPTTRFTSTGLPRHQGPAPNGLSRCAMAT